MYKLEDIKTTFLGLVLIIFASPFLTAQKKMRISNNNAEADIVYTRLPQNPVDAGYKTYSVDFSDPHSLLSRSGTNKKRLIKNYLKFDGFTYVSDTSQSDFHLNIELGNVNVLKRENKYHFHQEGNFIKNMKDAAAGTTVYDTTFYKLITYHLPASYINTDKEGKVMHQGEIISPKKVFNHT